MTRALRWFTLAALVWSSAAAADDMARDIWHHVAPGSPFYDPDRTNRHAAALVQSDGVLAVVELGTPEQGALVSVILPGDQSADQLHSILEMPAGNALSRSVEGGQLVAAQAPDTRTVTYAFRIDPADIELFMAGRRWKIRIADTTTTLTLKGSRKAIRAALRARDDKNDTASDGN